MYCQAVHPTKLIRKQYTMTILKISNRYPLVYEHCLLHAVYTGLVKLIDLCSSVHTNILIHQHNNLLPLPQKKA